MSERGESASAKNTRKDEDEKGQIRHEEIGTDGFAGHDKLSTMRFGKSQENIGKKYSLDQGRGDDACMYLREGEVLYGRI